MTLLSNTTAVVYYSGYGQTKRVAEAIAEGAAASLIAIDAEGNIPENGWETLNAANAIIFGSPTYMGGPSWQYKKFADTSSKPWFEDKWKNKIFGGFTNSASINGDKLNTLQYLSCWLASTAAFGSASPSSRRTSKHPSATIRTGWARTSRRWRSQTRMRHQAKCREATLRPPGFMASAPRQSPADLQRHRPPSRFTRQPGNTYLAAPIRLFSFAKGRCLTVEKVHHRSYAGRKQGLTAS
jgi:multimeric flavodoxin WrbA